MTTASESSFEDLIHGDGTQKLHRRDPAFAQFHAKLGLAIPGATLVGEFLREIESKRHFLDKESHPYLLLSSPTNAERSVDSFRTRRISKETHPTRSEILQRCVLPITNSHRNAFTQMVTVGRTDNNDLCIPIGQISKLHAYFCQRNGQWSITDCASSNGTSVDDEDLKSEVPYFLSSGQEIAFGQVLAAEFYPALDLLNFLEFVTKLKPASRR